jgi:hypothetical protein
VWEVTEQIHDEPRSEPMAKECEIIIRVADRHAAEVDYARDASLARRDEHMLGPEIGMQEHRGVIEVGVVFDKRFELGLDRVINRTVEVREYVIPGPLEVFDITGTL